MSIRKKFVVILGFVFVLSLFLSALFYNKIIISYFKETELFFIKREFISFSKNLDEFLGYLSNIASSETELLEQGKELKQEHKKLKLDFFIVTDHKGKPVVVECYLDRIKCQKLLTYLPELKEKDRGFLLVDNLLIGIVINRISDGMVVVGKKFNSDFYSGWLKIKEFGGLNVKGKPVAMIKEGDFSLRLYDTGMDYYRFDISFEDMLGNSINGFQGIIEKVLWNKGHITFHLFQFVLTLMFVGILSFVFFSVDRLVAKPVKGIISKIKNISREKDLENVYKSIDGDYGSLELNQLSKEIKDMILRIENLLRDNHEKTRLFQIIAENAPIGIALYTEKMEYINPAIEKITGYSKEEILGKDIKFFLGEMKPEMQEKLIETLMRRLEGKYFKNEFQTKIKTKDGQLKDILVITNTTKLFSRYYGLGIILDITEIKNLERKLNEMLDTDTLTGLLSRYGFTRKVEELIGLLSGKEDKYFLILVDISRFKVVNDSYGHQIGDRILKQIADRLRKSLHDADLVGRLAADVFGIFISKYAKFDDIALIIDKIIRNIENTVIVEDYRFNLTCSIGISIYPDDGTDIDTLLKRTDIALARAKERFAETQKSSVVFFSKELENKITERLELERELRYALEHNRDEFYVEYQPIYNLKTMKIEKLEALIRWNSSKFGKLSPFKFIRIAEETGLINQITDIVFERVTDDLIRWKEKGINTNVSINISPAEFKDFHFVYKIINRLGKDGLKRNISLEITENVLLEDVDEARKKIKALRNEGIDILLDDFGTGYSSLTYLKKFPISILKVDREFVKELPENGDDRGIVITIIQLSQLLSMDAVAEGIENELQVNFLKEIGCKYGQGYYFSRPVSPEDIEKMLH